MNRIQLFSILSALGLFFILYFGCETKPPEQKAIDKSRALVAESTDIANLLLEAKEELNPQQAASILALEQQLDQETSDSARLEFYKQLSSDWYRFSRADIAGYYAEKVADLANTDEAWAIAGTTYMICVQQRTEEKIRSYCGNRAVKAFENAISIAPEDSRHKVNLANVYTELPPADNPMKGILMLVELNKQQPENVLVLNQLARLAIKTSQFERAVERLEQAIAVESKNRTSNCLMVQAYKGLGNAQKANQFENLCNELSQ